MGLFISFLEDILPCGKEDTHSSAAQSRVTHKQKRDVFGGLELPYNSSDALLGNLGSPRKPTCCPPATHPLAKWAEVEEGHSACLQISAADSNILVCQ